jgi:hypothetical protein
LAWNDDHMEKEGHLHLGPGLLTHHADSYLTAELPEDGVYRVQMSDAQSLGGEGYGYRLRITPPRPDFALRLTPSSINVRAGRAAAVWVHALRKDGFGGEIEIALKDAPPGFWLHGARVPAGRDHVRMTLTAPPEPLDQPVSLQLEGHAQINGQMVSRPVAPAEDMMQAFLWRHLAPSQQLMVAVMGGRRFAPVIELADAAPVQIPAGGTAQVQIAGPRRPMLLQRLRLELDDPPEGLTLQDVIPVPGGMAFAVKADADAPQVGYADNLIVEAFVEVERKPRGDDKGPAKKQRISLGVLPAIPFEIVQ